MNPCAWHRNEMRQLHRHCRAVVIRSMLFKAPPRNTPGSVNFRMGLTKTASTQKLSLRRMLRQSSNGQLERIALLLLHFSSVPDPDQPILLFTSRDIIPTSQSFHHAIDELRISVRFLSHPRVRVSDHQARPSSLTKELFQKQLEPAKHVLPFQSDSILRANSLQRVEDILEYDFVGAPLIEERGVARLGGGLWLRNRSMILDIIEALDFKSESAHTNNPQNSEDRWFYRKCQICHSDQTGTMEQGFQV